jgi:hypothetical protein
MERIRAGPWCRREATQVRTLGHGRAGPPKHPCFPLPVLDKIDCRDRYMRFTFARVHKAPRVTPGNGGWSCGSRLRLGGNRGFSKMIYKTRSASPCLSRITCPSSFNSTGFRWEEIKTFLTTNMLSANIWPVSVSCDVLLRVRRCCAGLYKTSSRRP